MTKELARYFVKLIAEDLQFSFNGMGLSSWNCEWLENQLIQENFNEIEKFIKKRYDEHKKMSKKKRKFRVMTVKEWCDKPNCKKCEYCQDSIFCDYLQFNGITEMKMSNIPYKTKAGKYILIEVKE